MLESKYMKLRKLLLFVTTTISLALMSGCVSNDEIAHQKTTVMGIYTYEPACYAYTKDTSFVLRTEEATGMELPSGDRTQLLWGLISLEDY